MQQTIDPALSVDLKLRREKLQRAMSANELDAVLTHSNVNNLYLSGHIFAGYTYLAAAGEPLFFERRPAKRSGDHVFTIRKPEQIPAIIEALDLPWPQRLGLEAAELSHLNWRRLSVLWPAAEIRNASTTLAEIRAVKTAYEISLIKKTGSRHVAVIDQFPSVYEAGMTDQEWMIEMTALMLKAGSLGIFRVAGESMEAFMGTVLAGDNGAAVSPYDFALGGAGMHPSYPVGQCGVKLKPGMAVMVDIAANFYGYLTDCTRVFSIGGLSQRALDAHRLSMDIHAAVAERAVPGVVCEELYNLALDMAARAGFAECFMGCDQKARFIGHGTGLVINEQPVIGARSTSVLRKGMCVALEPKFVIPAAGAVGPEDTYLVTDKGMRSVTPSSHEIVEL